MLRLAMPFVLSSFSWTILTFIDRMYLMWWSQDSLAASFPAALLWWTSMCFPFGMCMYASTFVSQYFGAGKRDKIGPCVWQAVWVGVSSTPLVLLLLMPFAGSIFSAAGHSPPVRAEEIIYFQILCAGSAAMLISYAFSSFYSGQGRTAVVMVVDCGTAVANIVLDYLWIFGNGGFAAHGIEGAAWATVVALWTRVLVYVVLLLQATRNRVECRFVANGTQLATHETISLVRRSFWAADVPGSRGIHGVCLSGGKSWRHRIGGDESGV